MEIDKDIIARLVMDISVMQSIAQQLASELKVVKETLTRIMLEKQA